MATFQWGVICQRVIIDEKTNTVSYITAIEQITPSELPAPLPQMAIGSLWRREEEGETIEVRMTAVDDTGEMLAQTEAGVFTFDEAKRWRVEVSLQGIEVQRSGTVFFRLEKRQEYEDEWVTEAELPLDISEPLDDAPEEIELQAANPNANE